MPQEQENNQETETNSMGAMLSPMGIMMLMTAVLFDMAGLIIVCFGLDDLGILDIIGLVFVGGLMLIQSKLSHSDKKITATKGAKKVGGKVFKKLGLSFIGELIPWFGGIAPCWTIAVYLHLKNS